MLKSSSVLRDLHGSIQRHSSSSLKSLRNTLGMGVTVTETNKVRVFIGGGCIELALGLGD